MTDVAAPFEMSLNAVSKHIRILERADLVRRRRAGRDHFLSIHPAPVEEATTWLAAQRDAWVARLDALDALLKAEDESSRSRKGRNR